MIHPLGAVLITALVCSSAAFASTAVEVTATDGQTGEGLGGVSVVAQPLDAAARANSTPPPITTNDDGRADLLLTPGTWRLRLRHSAYRMATRRVEVTEAGVRIRVPLDPAPYILPETTAFATREPDSPGSTSMAPSEVRRYPAPTPDPLRVLRVLPGVATGGDQSASAYSVRGGSYDENLVYIEGVEIEAPLLLRNGLAETLSAVNPDLVRESHFHAGVLPVRLGDRLSSALEVGYRRPDSLSGEAAASALRQSMALGGRAGPTNWLLGVRRADLSRLTRGLQTDGDFSPQYRDLQGVLNWEGEDASATLFALTGTSEFTLTPTTISLRYDCVDPRVLAAQGLPPIGGCKDFYGDGAGRQVLRYRVDIAGMRVQQRWRELDVVAEVSGQRRVEREASDLVLRLHWSPRPGWPHGDVADSLRIDETYSGDLEIKRWDGRLTLTPGGEEPAWEAGAGVRHTAVEAYRQGEETLAVPWVDLPVRSLVDSARRTPLDLYAYGRRARILGGFVHEIALRAARFGGPDEYLLLPRTRLRCEMADWRLSAAAGLAAQPPLYKEALDATSMPRSQKGADAALELVHQTDRLRWRATGYYRHLWDQISCSIDDVEVRYSGRNDSRARVIGADAMVRGQIGKTFGTLSYSWLKARENLDGDGSGWVPRATDQRHTLAAYLEDGMNLRVTWMRASRFHIRVLYGSGFPFTPMVPETDDAGRLVGLTPGRRHSVRDDPYFRFDVGMTQVFAMGGLEITVREEVANLFDQINAVGYRQLPAPDGTVALLPRGLGRRAYNGEVRVAF